MTERAPPLAPSAATFFTSSIPLLPSGQSVSIASGYLPARSPPAGSSQPADDAHLYFVLERARHLPSKRRLIVWFNGGPGCSSFDGLMMEIGAFRPDQKGGIEWTASGGSWNEYADVLYLDQPVGTGFSYVSTSGYTKTLEQAADEVLYFLQKFIEVYPEYKSGNGIDTYLAGESFAGQYIPFTASALLKAGSANPVNLAGIAIGNGFIDPKSQAGSELEMMVESKLWTEESNEYSDVNKYVKECHEAIAKTKGSPRNIPECEGILSRIIELTTARKGKTERCINIYDVRLDDTAPACGMNWPPTLASTYQYLARDDVRKALHVDSAHKPEAWVECNHRVGASLRANNGEASVTFLPSILEAGVQVLLFAGDKDLICNHIGVERIPENVQWSGKGWENPVKRDWYVNNTLAGYWRSNRNLTYVSIAEASHMVGFDKPIQAHDMMLRFMGVDLIAAAGPSARIPSRLDGEKDRLVVLGGGLGTTATDDRPMIPGVDGKSEAQVAEEAKWAAYYNAGSAALIVLLLLVGCGVHVLLRLRRKARSQRGDIGLGATEDGGGHELDRFIVRDGSREEEDTYSDETYRQSTTNLAGGRVSRRHDSAQRDTDNEEIFDVGNVSDDGEEVSPRRG
ncbi:hypothetical protein CBS101457_006381 [Exobasidium rhododendri]|nr:hypothetical protein CBS101457_006381 [Exobasidium rhododendri]